LFLFYLPPPPAFAEKPNKLGPEHPTHIVTFDEAVVEAEDDGEVEEDERHKKNPDMWRNQNHKMQIMLHRLEKKHGFKSTHIYSWASHGFAATLTEKQIREIEKIPSARISNNQAVITQALWSDQSISGQKISWGNYAIGAPPKAAVSPYIRVYVLDTGVDLHSDLNVVARLSANLDKSVADCEGHGTSMAGPIGAKNNTSGTLGVAPGAPIISIKITEACESIGSIANTLRGIDMAVTNEVVKVFDCGGPIDCLTKNRQMGAAILNFSFGYEAEVVSSTDAASIKNAFKNAAMKTDYAYSLLTGKLTYPTSSFAKSVTTKGIFSVVPSSNPPPGSTLVRNACLSEPGAFGPDIQGMMTVGSINNFGSNSLFSYFGSCVEIWAPGESIVTTKLGGTTRIVSGTSIAAPFVAGIAALISQKYLTYLPGSIEALIQTNKFLSGYSSRDGTPIYVPNASTF
jgi:subtilisin